MARLPAGRLRQGRYGQVFTAHYAANGPDNQARSCALFAALMSNDLPEKAVESPRTFIDLMRGRSYRERQGIDSLQNHELFPK